MINDRIKFGITIGKVDLCFISFLIFMKHFRICGIKFPFIIQRADQGKFISPDPKQSGEISEKSIDEVGAAFGRTRPAVGFGLDVKALAAHTAPRPLRAAIRAPWHPSAAWQQAVHALRQSGQTVLVTLPGQEHVPDAFLCDRTLVEDNGQWLLQKTA